jgi:hypothetical protein
MEIIKKQTNSLKPSASHAAIYEEEDFDFDILSASISNDGILEPLIVLEDGTIISGVRRWKVAQNLGLNEVPVIITTKEDSPGLLVSHNLSRQKKPFEVLREWEIITDYYGLDQGARMDKFPHLKAIKEMRNENSTFSPKTIQRLKDLRNKAKELHSDDPLKIKDIIKKVNNGSVPISKMLNIVNEMLAEKHLKLNPKLDEKMIENENFKFYNFPPTNFDEVDNKSVSCIITRPPALNDYLLAGMEISKNRDEIVSQYVDALVSQITKCEPKLTPYGSIFISISDIKDEYGYSMITEQFIMAMAETGLFYLADRYAFISDNSNYLGFGVATGNDILFHFTTDTETQKINVEQKIDFKKEASKLGIKEEKNNPFPEFIVMLSILTASEEGDVVLDIFGGITTGKIARGLNRKFIGYSKDPKTYTEALKIAGLK